ncbi:MAG TPA: OmcA/MtrC family decaheme c-type cytochrome [Myxococcaceae bacterium]|nr:OmcA/MtrC family decaheme c-type cytochrome [Myxococcaceae bacterium]
MRIPLVALAIVALSLGCKGDQGPAGAVGPSGDAGPPGPPGSPGSPAVTTIAIPKNSDTPTDAASADWAALVPKVTVQSVTIGSPPKVTFKVTDDKGTPVVGLGNTSKSSTASVAGLTNLAFAIAKLVPSANGSPSKWVSYIVTTVPSLTADGGVGSAAATRPSTDNTGSLVDNGDGTYVYTFYRDITQIKTQVDGMTFTGANKKDDLGDLTYDSTKVHRLTIQLAGNAPGTGSNTPTGVTNVPGVPLQHAVDAIYDFNPGASGSPGTAVTTSGRDMVTTTNCDTCHQVLGGLPGDNPEASGAGFHGGSRNEVRYCVVCHTEQRKFGRTEAAFDPATLTFKSADGGTDINTTSTYRLYDRSVGNLPNLVHKIHLGEVLALKNYNFGGVTFNDVLYPQDIRNCTKCHDPTNATTPNADNYKKVPNRLACGACHDGIDFATGKGVTIADAMAGLTSTTIYPGGLAHGGGPQADDATCIQCHHTDYIDGYHVPVTPPNPQNSLLPGGTNANTNAAWISSNPARAPTNTIQVSYDIKSVSRNSSKQPVIVFRLLQNGQRKDLNDFATTTANPATGQKEIWDNFMGSPSLYFVYSVPQDGFTTPADFNASASGYLRGIWNGTATGTGAGTLTGPDSNGYYTGTLTGVTIPDSAVMLTGGIGYSYSVTSTLPLTQTNITNNAYPYHNYPVWNAGTTNQATPCVAAAGPSPKCNGGLISIAPNAQKVATGYTGRRPIVEDARCNKCHQELGTFTEDAFHAGQRNDGTTCAWCHTPNRASGGWSADSVYFVHAIHAGAKRSTEFTWHAATATSSYQEVAYPGVLNFCEGCHIPGAYNFENAASDAALPNRLYRTFANGSFSGHVGDTFTNYSGAGCATQTQSSPADAVAVHTLAPYFPPTATGTSTPNYGLAFSFNAGANPSNGCTPGGAAYTIGAGQSTEDNPAASASYDTNLVVSPITSVCFACHDTAPAMAHFEINGGSIYKARSTALNTTETCIVCHGPDRIADIKEVHSH